MSYPHAETGGVKEGFTMARNRDYDDGDFDQPKRSSPYQDMDGDEYDDDYADDYEDEYAASSVKKGARKGGGSAGGTVKILGGVIVLLVVILIALVVVRAVITNKRNANDGVKPSESVNMIPEQTTNPAPIVFGPVGDATDEPTVSGGDAYTTRTTLGGIYEETHFVVGVPIESNGALVGFVLAVTGARALTTMWRTFIGLFFMTAVTVLLLSFVVSAWVSMRQSRPIHEMAEATRRFAEGNFDVRMHNYEGVTEITELAEAFNSMADSLQETERQRREFIANVSHELKTPMTTIAGYTDGILDGTIPPAQEKEYLRIISDEARRLSRLVRRMLEVSQLQSRDLTRTKAPFDVCESMRRVLISMEKKITDRGLDVDADIPDGSIMVLGDNDLITQVIYNLLENATKFAREGSSLYLGVTTSNGKALVSVRNEGDTIPAEEIPLLFERFHKSDKSRSEDKDGVGLGLYVVKTILEQHKEHIAVTSENGLTTFTFTITLSGGLAPQ